MRLIDLSISNFRAISALELRDLPAAVVLAGPNGCGKSCVLDAIRLLKSAYGGYQQDEWQTWFGEFQINLNKDAQELLPVFQDRTRPLTIAGSFQFDESELAYLRAHSEELLEAKARRDLTPDGTRARRTQGTSLASAQRMYQPEIDRRKADSLPGFLALLSKPSHRAALTIRPLGGAEVVGNLLLEVIFSTYDPQEIGVIDYHGPYRNYNRERLASIPLTIESSEQRLRQHALYNIANKYANLKSEMASAYIRHLLARQADPQAALDDSLTTTLKELFTTFFPGKTFSGPRPIADGSLRFSVQLSNGAEHDIDDLSSGEKEVLYGYLRLHNAAPKHSIILIDEPELHLNPRLVSGLAAFYYRHLGSRLSNQLWLVTHSDTLIREAVAQPHFSVFHIHPTSVGTESQATKVKAHEELEKVVLALVGDLAAYRPDAKVVVFESTADAAFDMRMTCTLFPEFEQRTNPISSGDKRRVADLYDLLERARNEGHIPGRFFAITDSDDDPVPRPGNHYQWDVYHIENYLLHPRYILGALRAVGVPASEIADEEAVLARLVEVARTTISALVAHRLRTHANRLLVTAIDLGFDSARQDLGTAIGEAIMRSQKRLTERLRDQLSPATLAALESSTVASLEGALRDGSWVKSFRGRDILRRFAGMLVPGMEYEYFRDLIITRMSEARYQPPGMSRVVTTILEA